MKREPSSIISKPLRQEKEEEKRGTPEVSEHSQSGSENDD
jgi:hypothetical protein